MKKFIIEGIDIDTDNKIVSYNPKHQKNVDTSIEINPTYKKFNNFEVISIFKRKRNELRTDGNPLIYALKGLKGWTIKTKDILLLLKQFIKITSKIEPKYDTIIMVPSKNELNQNFLFRLNKIIKADNTIIDAFSKLEVGEVHDNYVDRTHLSDVDSNDLTKAFKRMIKYTDYFSYKYIPTHLRKYIQKSMFLEDDNEIDKMINDKDILILDDTISTGSTISETTKRIYNTFVPKSITVITLFSSLK